MASEAEGPRPWSARALALASRSWEWCIVALLSFWMLLVRLRPFSGYNHGDEVHFIGTDPYYHARQVLYSVDNFPHTLGYDAMTQYPLGTSSGQFGTLFDQGAAALAWIWGLIVDGGHPTEATVLDVFTAYPAILGALTIIPAYLVARHLAGRGPALVTALVLALIPGEFMVRSLAAYVDHHVMELLWSTFSVWGVLITLRAWERSEVTLRQLVDAPREVWSARTRRPLALSLLATLFFWAYIASWPPGVLFIGIVGVWLVIDVVIEQVRGRDPSPVVLTAISVFLPLALVLFLVQDHAYGFSALQHTWLQPTAALILALAAAILGALSLLWNRRGLPRAAYPAVVLGIGLLGGGFLRVTLPMLFSNLENGFGWITGLGVRSTRLTIAEAQPIIQPEQSPCYEDALCWINREMTGEFGLMAYIALAGFLIVCGRAVRGDRRGDTLLVIWALLMTTATFTQVRFFYYLAVVVALLSGEVFASLARLFQRSSTTTGARKGKGAKQRKQAATSRAGVGAPAFAALIVLLAMLPVNVFGADRNPSAWELAGYFGPDEERRWSGPLMWLRDNSPPIPIGLDDDFERPPAGEHYPYPDGTYGVLAWWDYGHQIELQAQRPPVANPFQQQAPLASRILTADSEAAALAELDAYLQGDPVRYVIVDDATATSKFGAIAIWAERYDEYNQAVNREFQVPPDPSDPLGGEVLELPVLNPQHKQWFVQRLYNDDARGYDHFRLVYEAPVYTYIGYRVRIAEDGQLEPRQYNSPIGHNSARNFLESFGDLNYDSGRTVLQTGENTLDYAVHLESSVKIYERVPGARLTGLAEPGAGVTAEVDLVTTNTERVVTYRQTATAGSDGRFEMRVSYASGDPVALEDGGTNYALRAVGPYMITVGDQSAPVDVPDGAVLGGETIEVEFGLGL